MKKIIFFFTCVLLANAAFGQTRKYVKVFMHLGDEFKNMILTILIPLVLFVWFIIAFLMDGSFWLWINHHFTIR